MSKQTTGLWTRWVMIAPWVYGTMSLGLSVIFGAVAVYAQLWPIGIMALLLLGVGAWNLSTGIRLRKAQRQGASPVSTLIQGSARGAGFVVSARQTSERQSRSGAVVILNGVAAFVPLSDWQGLLASTLTQMPFLRVIRVTMMQAPQSLDALHALVEANQGFYLDGTWVWSMPGRMLTSSELPSIVSVRLRKPHIDLWQTAPLAPNATKKAIVICAVLTAVILCVSVPAWWFTENDEILQAGLCYAAMTGIIVPLIIKRINARQ